MSGKRGKPKPMKEDPSLQEESPSPEQDDSIEILEVVGLDESGAVRSEEKDAGGGDASSSDTTDGIPYTRQQLYDMLLRNQAEFENARKRMERDREEFERRIWMDLLQRLLPILDNFQRALGEGVAAQPGDAFRQGVSLTIQQMTEILSREGLEEVPTLGERFDPHVHEAVDTRAVKGFEEGMVLEELRKGYKFRGHLLRPALVRVSAKHGTGPDDPA
jgi:molecular chaperone GrpE